MYIQDTHLSLDLWADLWSFDIMELMQMMLDI